MDDRTTPNAKITDVKVKNKNKIPVETKKHTQKKNTRREEMNCI